MASRHTALHTPDSRILDVPSRAPLKVTPWTGARVPSIRKPGSVKLGNVIRETKTAFAKNASGLRTFEGVYWPCPSQKSQLSATSVGTQVSLGVSAAVRASGTPLSTAPGLAPGLTCSEEAMG